MLIIKKILYNCIKLDIFNRFLFQLSNNLNLFTFTGYIMLIYYNILYNTHERGDYEI